MQVFPATGPHICQHRVQLVPQFVYLHQLSEIESTSLFFSSSRFLYRSARYGLAASLKSLGWQTTFHVPLDGLAARVEPTDLRCSLVSCSVFILAGERRSVLLVSTPNLITSTIS